MLGNEDQKVGNTYKQLAAQMNELTKNLTAFSENEITKISKVLKDSTKKPPPKGEISSDLFSPQNSI